METPPEFAKAVFGKALQWLDNAYIESNIHWVDVKTWKRTAAGVFRFAVNGDYVLYMDVTLADNGEIKVVSFDGEPF